MSRSAVGDEVEVEAAGGGSASGGVEDGEFETLGGLVVGPDGEEEQREERGEAKMMRWGGRTGMR